jgi:DNA-binding CsgD family transcriptional regulator
LTNLAENGSDNNDNDNNNGYKRGPYKPLQKLKIKQEIYNRILQGYSYQSIMESLRMPERTFYHYLQSIRQEEKDFLKDTISKEEMKWQTQLSHDRLEASLNTLNKWIEDPHFKDKVGAMHLICEINAAIMRLYVYGPSYVKRYEEGAGEENNSNGSSNQKKEEDQNDNKELLELRRLNQELAKEEEHMHYVNATAAQWEDFQRRKKKFLEKYYSSTSSTQEREEAAKEEGARYVRMVRGMLGDSIIKSRSIKIVFV